jgi:hypothetical protein
MQPMSVRNAVVLGLKTLGRLGLGMLLFALIAATPASSAPQPQVCKSAIRLSV